jgi:hypothetical protein
MTSREELNRLQINARKAGRIANFCFSKEGFIDCVFYLDSKGKGREKAGMTIDPLTFAEKERLKQNNEKTSSRFSFLRKSRKRFAI